MRSCFLRRCIFISLLKLINGLLPSSRVPGFLMPHPKHGTILSSCNWLALKHLIVHIWLVFKNQNHVHTDLHLIQHRSIKQTKKKIQVVWFLQAATKLIKSTAVRVPSCLVSEASQNTYQMNNHSSFIYLRSPEDES